MHRYRFKSIGLAPVSEKTQTIPIPTNDDTSSDATSQSAVTSFISPPDTQKAEVLWVLHTVTRHNSFKSNDDIRGVFAAMFPDSQLAKSFTCGEKNPAYVAKYGIASFIKKELSCSVSEKPYLIQSVIQIYVCYVGSVLHHKGTKQMKMPTVSFDCLHLYWPNSVGRVIVSYYTVS